MARWVGGFGQLGNQEEPQYRYRKGLLSQGSNSIAMKSRVNREVQARIRERLVVRFHWPTRQAAPSKAAFRGLKAPAPSAQKRCKLNKTKTNLRTFVSFLAGRRSQWTTVTKRHGGRFSAACKARLILSHLCTG